VIDEESGARRSALTEASRLIARMAEDGVKSIGFVRSRRAAELLAEFARRELEPELRPRVKSYRAGYLAEDRRELERQLANDELLAVASTNALELGIDIGSLDAAVLVGYPGTRASMWQQAGRAGRRAEGSLAVLVAQDEPLDQFLVTHPADLFDRPPEAAVIDPTNPYILEPHLACAARELPLTDEEAGTFWPGSDGALERLAAEGALARRRDRWHDRSREAPHRRVNLRSAGGRTFAIVIEDTGELLGTVDESRAYSQVHPGAVYLHQGEQFEVRELDLVGRVALVSRSDPDFYTQARDTTDIGVDAVDRTGTSAGGVPTFFGSVHVTDQVVGYARKHVATGEILEVVPLALPPQSLATKAVWWAIPRETIERAAIDERSLPGAAHAAEHAAIGLLPLVATCDRWDVGGVSTAHHPDTGSCAIFVYDGYPGGAGIAQRGFEDAARWLAATLETVRGCPCPSGCPSCVKSPKCGNGNEPLDKAGAVALLAAMLGKAWG
jgi:DEAD/DEAH box helicase domain-containing protein